MYSAGEVRGHRFGLERSGPNRSKEHVWIPPLPKRERYQQDDGRNRPVSSRRVDEIGSPREQGPEARPCDEQPNRPIQIARERPALTEQGAPRRISRGPRQERDAEHARYGPLRAQHRDHEHARQRHFRGAPDVREPTLGEHRIVHPHPQPSSVPPTIEGGHEEECGCSHAEHGCSFYRVLSVHATGCLSLDCGDVDFAFCGATEWPISPVLWIPREYSSSATAAWDA